MATSTYEAIYTTTLASAAEQVLMAGIPQGYSDLRIVIKGGVTSRTGQYMYLNGDTTSSNYRYVYMYGNGTSTNKGTTTGPAIAEVVENDAANLITIDILDYSASKHKTSIIRASNPTANGVELRASRWASTSAITSVDLTAVGTTWLAGTSFSLFGIAGVA